MQLQQVSYTYDANNRMVSRTVQLGVGSPISVYFIYDGNQMTLALDDEGNVEHRLLWGPAIDQILADENGEGDVFWMLTDHQNTVRDVVEYDAAEDETNVVNHIAYDSFGNKLSETDDTLDMLDINYTGRYFDEATGLQWNLNRWYSPEIGRWMSEDPIGFTGRDANLNRYVENNAISRIDPTGLMAASFVGDGPQVSFDSNARYGAGAFAATWIELSESEKASLINSNGGFLIESNNLKFTLWDADNKVLGSGNRTLWFLMYFIKNGNALEAHHTHRQDGRNDRQYKQLFNWQWGEESGKYDLDKITACKGRIEHTSTFELFTRGTSVALADKFKHSHDVAIPGTYGNDPITDELIELTPPVSVGQDASGFDGDFIDEIGYISKVEPWRSNMNRTPLSQMTIKVTIEWDWTAGKQEPSIKSTMVPGGTIGKGPQRTSDRSQVSGSRPTWAL